MQYVVKHRLPNFIEHNPYELEEKVVKSFNEILDMEFMVFHALQQKTHFIIIQPHEDEQYGCDYLLYVYNPLETVENTDPFDTLMWVGRIKEFDDDVENPTFYSHGNPSA